MASQLESNKTVLIIFLIVCAILLSFQIFSVDSNKQHDHQKTLDLSSIFHSQISKTKVPKIAYIFAGSARSFICPKVHWSIRSHLIDSLGGDAYCFVRISSEDNVNTKTGLGTAWKPDYRSNEILETLKILNPREVEYFTFSNQTEEMKANYPGEVHRVFRENDQRRYSMFYHRCMAYKMATKYENQHNIKFDWVVLVRLDAAWVEPVMPIETFSTDRVWATETGFEVFNDQFMLIPRQFSDYVYDFNMKVRKGVYCLGGPDVEKWKCNATALVQHNYNPQQIASNLEYCCTDRDGIDEQGYSEIIHKRHMLYGKIPMALGKFPVMLTRLIMEDFTCQFECERLQLHVKEIFANGVNKAYKYMSRRSSYDTRAMALDFHDHSKCAMMRKEFFSWNPISAVQLHALYNVTQNIANTQLTQIIHDTPQDIAHGIRHKNSANSKKSSVVDYSQSLYTQRDVLHSSVLMNLKDLEMWRLHPTWNAEGCLSYDFTAHNLTWRDCIDHFKFQGGNRGNSEQGFFLQVIPHTETTSPKIMTPLDRKIERNYQLQMQQSVPTTAVDGLKIDKSGVHKVTLLPQVNRNVTRVAMVNRLPKVLWSSGPIRCLTVIGPIALDAKVAMSDCINAPPHYTEYHSSQAFQTVIGLTRGSHHRTSVGRLHVFNAPELCVARDGTEEKGHANYPISDFLTLLPCFKEGFQHRILFEFELVA